MVSDRPAFWKNLGFNHILFTKLNPKLDAVFILNTKQMAILNCPPFRSKQGRGRLFFPNHVHVYLLELFLNGFLAVD
jgi:hypothetical protein